MDTKKGDLIIGGYGSAAGGEYGAIKINGYGRITGDVACGDMRVNGMGEAAGVECASLHINGSGDLSGALKAGELKVSGAGTFSGAARCETAKVTGTAAFRAGLDAQLVDVSGSIKVKGDCNAERFVSSGVFEVEGLLSADHIEVYLDWNRSRAGEIGGADISVRPGPRGIGVLRSIFGHSPALETGTIEGNEISLELTKAAVVRGNNVSLGEGCDIGLVEYRGTLRKMGNAKVREEKKV